VFGHLGAVSVGDLEVDTAELVYTRSLTGMISADDHEPLACRVHACRVAVSVEAAAVRR
jgi:hypothetical protein